MTTDIRALCKELTNELHGYASANPHHDSDELVIRARATLASEPEPPADGEVEAVLEAAPAEPFSGSGLSGLITGQIGCARVGSGTPTTFRWGRRNGTLVLQVGYAWRQGAEHGVDWKDVPTVDLDNEAQP